MRVARCRSIQTPETGAGFGTTFSKVVQLVVKTRETVAAKFVTV